MGLRATIKEMGAQYISSIPIIWSNKLLKFWYHSNLLTLTHLDSVLTAFSSSTLAAFALWILGGLVGLNEDDFAQYLTEVSNAA